MAAPILGIVPARGGSRGVIGKNMRPLAGRPLIGHTLDAAAASGVCQELVVSSDDDEILRWSELQGFDASLRPTELAGPDTTIADVAAHLVQERAWSGLVAVFQPTSPLRSACSIRGAVRRFESTDADSLMSVVRERHLLWLDDQDDLTRATPLFGERVNRQYARHQVVRETGAIQLIRSDCLLSRRSMVGPRHVLFELPDDEGIDIDTVDDLAAARRMLERGTVVLRFTANRRVGSGHLYHCLRLAEELSDQRVLFLLRDCEPFAEQMLDERGYQWSTEHDLAVNLSELVGEQRPSVLVNDILDTTIEDVVLAKAMGLAVVNIEDLGPGARHADWVVNALYPSADAQGNVAVGPRFATLRNEFLSLPDKEVAEVGTRVLVTFGGTDPAGLGPRLARALCALPGLQVKVVAGPGAGDASYPPECDVTRSVRSMAAEMMAADVVLTSAGRTVYEAAACGTPVVVVAQNAREATHAHLSYEGGVIFLGIGALMSDDVITDAVCRLLSDVGLRRELSVRLRRTIDGRGAARISDGVKELLKGVVP